MITEREGGREGGREGERKRERWGKRERKREREREKGTSHAPIQHHNNATKASHQRPSTTDTKTKAILITC